MKHFAGFRGNVKHIVVLKSREFGREEFKYDTLIEAEEGMKRLLRDTQSEQARDGIKRDVYMLVPCDCGQHPHFCPRRLL